MSKKYKVNDSTKAYFVGGGIASLSAALFLIRDAKVDPKNITILEQMNINGGSCDGAGNSEEGYMIRGGRMINYEHYTAILDLYRFVPSLTDPKTSVTDEIYKFSNETLTCSTARLIDENHQIVKNVDKLGFNNDESI